MSGIVGIDLTPARVKEILTAYLTSYYTAMDRAIDEAGGRLQISVNGGDPWAPKFPEQLRPAWAAEVRATHDGETFYVDIDGAAQHGVFVTQDIVVSLHWDDENHPHGFRVAKIDVEPMRIRLFDDQSLDLQEARAATSGLIAAGKLMASLLEPAGGE